MSKSGIVLLILVFCILVILWLQAKRKKIKEEKFQAMKNMRESSLKEALSNNLEEHAENLVTPYRPYKVNYSTGENQDSKENRPLLQLIERNKLAEKQFIFRSNDRVAFGVQFGMVAILNNRESAEVWCEVFFQNGAYCIRSYEIGNVYVQRKRTTAIVDKVGIQLKSGDTIQLQETTFQIFYLKG